MEGSEAAVEKGSPRFITAHPGHHTNTNQPWSFSVILGLSFPSGKVDCPDARLWRWFSSGWPLGVSNFEALSTKTMIREDTH